MGHRQPDDHAHQPGMVALAAGPARPAVTAPPLRPSQGTLPARRRPVALPPGHTAPGSAVPRVPVPARSAGGKPAVVLPAPLPPAVSVLAVIARPGQESAELGAVLSAFGLAGARLSVLCLTRGEGSELNTAPDRLETVRPWELQVAASLLRVSSVTIADYPDGRLSCLPPPGLAAHIRRAIGQQRADLLLVVDPAVVPEADTAATAQAACLAAREEGLAVLARTRPGPGSRWEIHLGDQAATVRARQYHAIRAHTSQLPSAPPPLPASPLAPAPSQPDCEVVRWLLAPRT